MIYAFQSSIASAKSPQWASNTQISTTTLITYYVQRLYYCRARDAMSPVKYSMRCTIKQFRTATNCITFNIRVNVLILETSYQSTCKSSDVFEKWQFFGINIYFTLINDCKWWAMQEKKMKTNKKLVLESLKINLKGKWKISDFRENHIEHFGNETV